MRATQLIFVTAALALVASTVDADPLACSLTAYKSQSGLTAFASDNGLTVSWDGEKNQEARLRFAVDNGTPTIRELAVRRKGGQWVTLAANVTPEYRVVSGLRRATDQQ